MKFLDEAKIYVKSGDGGAGCISFRREKFVEFGGPDGGNGGRGGDVIFEVADGLNTLIDFRYSQHFKAKNGTPGMGRNRSGPGGADCVIKVPVGTQVIDEDKQTILLDFTTVGQRLVFLKGGDGGFGNTHYKSSVNQAPRRNSPGFPGQERAIWLRLKLIADIGLLGMPNAGKSTFLSCCSRAKPKIADYPFTTLHPNLGVVKVGDQEIVMADIPGLIEGAHEGHGLGTRFLGHVERTSALLHLIDATQDDPAAAYKLIRNELEAYGQNLVDKKEIIALTKCDALDEESIELVKQEFQAATGITPYAISAPSKMGLDPLLYDLLSCTESQTEEESKEEAFS